MNIIYLLTFVNSDKNNDITRNLMNEVYEGRIRLRYVDTQLYCCKIRQIISISSINHYSTLSSRNI